MEENSKKQKLSTDSYKGVRDFYPEDMAVQDYIFDNMKKTVESFGYAKYDASILEPSELYESKTSEEIVKEQTYTFEDRGGRKVTLRPEMTPTVARMVAGKRRELGFPLRWYSIPNMFRYERPQRGRLREHWQLNVDLFGVSSLEAEIEIITIASQIMKDFGAKDADFEIRINSRKLIDRIFKYYSLSEGEEKELARLIDKKEKVSKEDFKGGLSKILSEKTGLADIFFNFLYKNDFNELPEKLRDCEERKELENVINVLKDTQVSNVVFDSSIMRGFDYYTGLVFEVFDTSPENNRSLFGGGRYDNLLDLFGDDRIPTVGFGMGDVTMRDFLETHELLPKYESKTDLYICVLPNTSPIFVLNFAHQLRMQDINVSIDWTNRRVGDEIKTADKQSIPFFTCVGENELDRNVYMIKNLNSGVEKKCNSLKKIVKLIKK